RAVADDAVRVVGRDLDPPAELAELRHGPRREAHLGVDVAIGVDEVVGVLAGAEEVVVEARELDGAEALEEGAGGRLGAPVARAGAAADEELAPAVGGADPGPA